MRSGASAGRLGRGRKEAREEAHPGANREPGEGGHGGSLRRSREGTPSHEYNKI